MSEYNLNNIEAMKACLNGEMVVRESGKQYKYESGEGFLFKHPESGEKWRYSNTIFDSSIKFKIHKESLTFERIKNECEPMKTLFIDKDGCTRLYIGFNRIGELITDDIDGSDCLRWDEKSVQNWTIKKYEVNNAN